MRQIARGQSESALDVFEVETVGLSLLLDFFDEAGAQLSVGNCLRRSHDEIALAANRHQSRLGATVPVRVAEILHGQSSHQKILQDAVLDHLDALGGNTFVIEAIKARQLRASESVQRGIVGDAEELGHDFFVHLLGESLAFVAAPLALSFDAMAEYFVKENGGGATRE